MSKTSMPTARPPAFHAWQDTPYSPQMVDLPPGRFVMGENTGDKFANDTERPAHEVCIGAGLAISRFPVTVGEFRQFRPDPLLNESPDLPMVRVSWGHARAYCAWLTAKTGRPYRLPSEAEWEYACRAGSQSLFAFGDDLPESMANYLYNENGLRVGPGKLQPVGSYPVNNFGLHDLHGNICEWVEDTWHPNYLGAPAQGEAWVEGVPSRRVIRGGAWDYLPRLLRSSWRDWRPADQRADNLGFRVAASGASGK